MKPHILIANVYFAPQTYGGATVVAEEVARALHRSGRYRVTAVSVIARDDLAAYAVIRSEVQGIANYMINLPPSRRYAESYDNPAVTYQLEALIASLSPDLIHAHCLQDIGVGVLLAADRAGVPVVLSVHDYWWVCERQFMVTPTERFCGQDPVTIEACRSCQSDVAAGRLRQKVLFGAARTAARVTYPSAFALSLCERSGLAPGKGIVLCNGVTGPDEGFFRRQEDRRKACNRLTFGYVGGPSTLKGWRLIREAFARLAREDFDVLLVDGGLHAPWWTAAALSGLPGTWRVVPRYQQDNMDAFYAQVDVLLFPSQWPETFGLVVREAAARGIHVVQTAAGGAMEHGGFNPARALQIGEGPETLSRQISDLLQNGLPDTQASAAYSYDDQARAFSAIADDVLQGRQPHGALT